MASDEYATFGELRNRLDEIVVEVRKKDLSLEKSLDLYEEAIKLGNRCAELVDKPDYTEEEAAAALVKGEEASADAADDAQTAQDAAEGAGEGPAAALDGE